MNLQNKPLILVVDDTPQNIQVLGNILYNKGYNVAIASSGAGALQSVKNKTPDLILLDIQMPEMDGFEVCVILKSQFETKEIPVIFLTASTETENILKGFEVGAIDFITKPFNSAELLARISTHIELKKSKEKIEFENVKIETLNTKLQSTNNKLNVAYNKIKDSINYAKRIQENLLPDLSFLTENGIEHFVIYKPKNIISGDFYFATQITTMGHDTLTTREHAPLLIVAVADCTGHGVPGALLSMLGHNFLYEIVNIGKVYDPAEILNKLNTKFRKILKQEITLSHDGMDIAICVISTTTNIIEYAGAKRPICYYNNEHFIELVPNKFSIGGLENNNSVFNKQIIELKSGNKVFMFTDGITDQFDSSNKKKITRKGFENKLSLLANKPLKTIKKDLKDYLKDWQGNNMQTDDILVFSFEIL